MIRRIGWRGAAGWVGSPWGLAAGSMLVVRLIAVGMAVRTSEAVPRAPSNRPVPTAAGEPSVAELRLVSGIGGTLARRILASRWAHPPGDGARALDAVEGLGPVRRARIAEHGLLAQEHGLESGEGSAQGLHAGTLGRGVLSPILIPADAEPGPHPTDG